MKTRTLSRAPYWVLLVACVILSALIPISTDALWLSAIPVNLIIFALVMLRGRDAGLRVGYVSLPFVVAWLYAAFLLIVKPAFLPHILALSVALILIGLLWLTVIIVGCLPGRERPASLTPA